MDSSFAGRRMEDAVRKSTVLSRWQFALLQFVLLVFTLHEARAETANGAINAEIETSALSVRNLGGLDFGKFLPYGRTGTIVLLPDGTLQANNVHLVDPAAVRLSSWEVTGTPGAAYSVTLPGVGNVIANGMSMSISPFVRSGPAQLALDEAGFGRLTIGGYLNIPPYIVPGRYTGTFTITVNYN
jgi:hypothetical protein